MYAGGDLPESMVESCSSFLSVLDDKGPTPYDYCISIVCKLIFVGQIINGTVNTFKSFEWFESSGEQSEASELGVGCGCVHVHDDATTNVLRRACEAWARR